MQVSGVFEHWNPLKCFGSFSTWVKPMYVGPKWSQIYSNKQCLHTFCECECEFVASKFVSHSQKVWTGLTANTSDWTAEHTAEHIYTVRLESRDPHVVNVPLFNSKIFRDYEFCPLENPVSIERSVHHKNEIDIEAPLNLLMITCGVLIECCWFHFQLLW